jgi:hypothetical protein
MYPSDKSRFFRENEDALSDDVVRKSDTKTVENRARLASISCVVMVLWMTSFPIDDSQYALLLLIRDW